MKRQFASWCCCISIGLFTLGLQSKLAAQSSAGQSSEVHRSIPTALTKGLDSRKLKAGDPVVCETTAILLTRSGKIPAGTRILGHVTEAKALSKGDSESSLGIAFDAIELKGGEKIPIKGVIQAVAPSLPPTAITTDGMLGGLSMGSGGQASGTGGDASTVAPASGGVGETTSGGPTSGIHPLYEQGPTPVLNNQSQGVLGINNLQLAKDSVLQSTGKEVKLDDRTQIMVSVTVDRPKR